MVSEVTTLSIVPQSLPNKGHLLFVLNDVGLIRHRQLELTAFGRFPIDAQQRSGLIAMFWAEFNYSCCPRMCTQERLEIKCMCQFRINVFRGNFRFYYELLDQEMKIYEIG